MPFSRLPDGRGCSHGHLTQLPLQPAVGLRKEQEHLDICVGCNKGLMGMDVYRPSGSTPSSVKGGPREARQLAEYHTAIWWLDTRAPDP